MTKIFDFKNIIDESALSLIANDIRNGGLVIFPTETVYGIGANAYNKNAVDNIFVAKGRANDNPLIVHVSDFDMLNNFVEGYNDIEKSLMDAFMPGPFTLILRKKNIIPDNVTCGLDTVGIRMPNNIIAHKLIELSGVPIAAPSANISGRPSGTNINDIKNEFDGKVDYIIDGGMSDIGLESTVVKVIDGIPTILRPGRVTENDILSIVGKVKVHDAVLHGIKKNEKIESPGMKYKHYAPNAKSLLIYSNSKDEVLSLINQNIVNNTCVLGPSEFENIINSKYYLSYGNYNDLKSISHNIFSLLRSADALNPDLIIIVGVEEKELGLAIMNRLIRSVGYNYIKK